MTSRQKNERAGAKAAEGEQAAAAPAANASAEKNTGMADGAAQIPPRREDGSEWPEVGGMKPGDPGYGIMLEQLEWEQRKQRRYSVVLAAQIAFIVVVVGVIVYFIVTA